MPIITLEFRRAQVNSTSVLGNFVYSDWVCYFEARSHSLLLKLAMWMHCNRHRRR